MLYIELIILFYNQYNQIANHKTFSIVPEFWQNNKIELSGFKDGVIFASAKSAVYVNDLNLRKRQIINKLNQYLGKKLIKNIIHQLTYGHWV